MDLKFSECTLISLEKMFDLTVLDESPILESWLTSKMEFSQWEKESLKFFQKLLRHNVHNWNEIELIQNFIGPIFSLANFSGRTYNYFAEREIRGKVGDVVLYGNPDGMIASGFREPEKPYFCFQEYKKHLDPKGDPAGQTLAAMITAQELNQHQYTVYGCYIVGDVWRFMILEEREYSLSNSYSATADKGIFEIFSILKALKNIVKQFANEI